MNKHKHHPQEEHKKTADEAQPGAPAGAEPAPAAGNDSSKPARPAEAAEAEKLRKAEEECARLKDQLLRLGADFENFRKRSLREKNEICENANEALALDLLPIIDHLQLALKAAAKHKANLAGSPRPEPGTKTAQSHLTSSGQAEASFLEGLRLIHEQMMNTLAKFGLEPFESEKQPFDPARHEAVSCLPSEKDPEGTVMTQSRQGYRFKKKILRPAQVVVSSGKAELPLTENKENSNN
ncbi:MAG: nucleotide exchange factor GrpE [Kiritimatiellia bacterium]